MALLLLPESDAGAIPKDPPAEQTQVTARSEAPLLLARRRRRRRRRPRRRRRRPHRRARKPAPKPKPAAAPAPAPTPAPAPDPQVAPSDLRRGGRVEFDGRLVQGQTAKSGAIYLFARKRSELKSMVQERTSYRKEVLRTVYPGWEDKD